MTRIVALGDSTTAGTPGFLSPLEAPPGGRGDVTSQYAYWLMQAHPDWDVLNRGVNGERSDQIRARFDRDVLDASPAAVVIVAGVNDVYQGHTATADQNVRMREVNGWIRANAPHVADTRAAVAAPGDPDRLRESPDDLHPSPNGYREMAEAVRRTLEETLYT